MGAAEAMASKRGAERRAFGGFWFVAVFFFFGGDGLPNGHRLLGAASWESKATKDQREVSPSYSVDKVPHDVLPHFLLIPCFATSI